MHCIEDGIEGYDATLTSPDKVIILDGMAVVNQVDMTNLNTCKDFATAFVNRLQRMVSGYSEVQLIFDRYLQESLKSRTRDIRTSGIQVR